MNLKKKIVSVLALLLIIFSAEAQNRTISLEEAVRLGVQNSKQLKLAKNKIDQAVSQSEQVTALCQSERWLQPCFNVVEEFCPAFF
jgi:hypothetical protein